MGLGRPSFFMPFREGPRVQVHWLWKEREVQLCGDAAAGVSLGPVHLPLPESWRVTGVWHGEGKHRSLMGWVEGRHDPLWARLS